MAVTLNTTIDKLMFSASLPDLSFRTDSDSEAVIILRTKDTDVFDAVRFPSSRRITVHDLRSVIEMYLRDSNLTLDEFELLTIHDDEKQTQAIFQIIYLPRFHR